MQTTASLHKLEVRTALKKRVVASLQTQRDQYAEIAKRSSARTPTKHVEKLLIANTSASAYCGDRAQWLQMCEASGAFVSAICDNLDLGALCVRWVSNTHLGIFLDDLVSERWLRLSGIWPEDGAGATTGEASTAQADDTDEHARDIDWLLRLENVLATASRLAEVLGSDRPDVDATVRARAFTVVGDAVVTNTIAVRLGDRPARGVFVCTEVGAEDGRRLGCACVCVNMHDCTVELASRDAVEAMALTHSRSTAPAWQMAWDTWLKNAVVPGHREGVSAQFDRYERDKVSMLMHYDRDGLQDFSRFAVLEYAVGFWLMHPHWGAETLPAEWSSSAAVDDAIPIGELATAMHAISAREREGCLEHTPTAESRRRLMGKDRADASTRYIGLRQLIPDSLSAVASSVDWLRQWGESELDDLCTCEGVDRLALRAERDPPTTRMDRVVLDGTPATRWPAMARVVLFSDFANCEGELLYCSRDAHPEESRCRASSSSASDRAVSPEQDFFQTVHTIVLSTQNGFAPYGQVLVNGIPAGKVSMRPTEVHKITYRPKHKLFKDLVVWRTRMDGTRQLITGRRSSGVEITHNPLEGIVRIVPTAEHTGTMYGIGRMSDAPWGTLEVVDESYSGSLVSRTAVVIRRPTPSERLAVTPMRPIKNILFVFFPTLRDAVADDDSDSPAPKRSGIVRRDVFTPGSRAADWTIRVSVLDSAPANVARDCSSATENRAIALNIDDPYRFAFVVHPAHCDDNASPPELIAVKNTKVSFRLRATRPNAAVWNGPLFARRGEDLDPPMGIYTADRSPKLVIALVPQSRP